MTTIEKCNYIKLLFRGTDDLFHTDVGEDLVIGAEARVFVKSVCDFGT